MLRTMLSHSLEVRGLMAVLGLSLTAPHALAQIEVRKERISASRAAERKLESRLTGEAKESYLAGARSLKVGHLTEALRAFQRAFEQSGESRVLLEIAKVEYALEHHVRAAHAIERYLEEAGAQASAEEMNEAKALYETTRAFVADVSFSVQPEGVDVFVDDQPIGVSPFSRVVPVEAGTRRIHASKVGYAETTLTREFFGGAGATVEITLSAELREGRLKISAGPTDVISVDGKTVAKGRWEGTLPSGLHVLSVTGKGKRPYNTEVAIQHNETQSLNVALESEAIPGARETTSKSWLWIAGGCVLAVGIGVGAYFLLKPEDRPPPPPVGGTLPPGQVPLSARF